MYLLIYETFDRTYAVKFFINFGGETCPDTTEFAKLDRCELIS